MPDDAKLYWTDKPCINGHQSPRYVSSYGCVQCAKDRAAANPERRKQITRAYYHRHVSEIAEKVRVKNAAKPKKGRPEPKGRDPAKAKIRRDRWAASHREQIKEKNRLWGRQNRDKTSAAVRNRRARARAAEGVHTAKDTAKIRRLQRDQCAYCRAPLRSSGHLDHIVALAKGGSNWPSNLQWLCASCNRSKHTKDAIVFSQERGLLL